jgi:hypothetical protein
LVEAQKIIQAYQLRVPGRLAETYSVKDINLNGLREIALMYDWEDGCDGRCTFRSLDLLEFKSGKLQLNASLMVARGGDVSPQYRFTYTVYVLKGSKPIFVGVHSAGKNSLTFLNVARSSFLEIKVVK